MSFQSYLTNIQKTTGNSLADFQRLVDARGFSHAGALGPGVKAGEIVAWLKEDFELGHGHAMAIYAYLKGKRE
ncbi:DUF4287 domain-containing protein [Kordiimonas aestuarii]|uniref:DUF4287 domain-containing protein n=1 Tax=Kordiimonas aestuarii TaxID=1005925 RepID=UPI0021D306FA|nr:DUF4287 domain-containing protein [Kordiimonas aestuarii]